MGLNYREVHGEHSKHVRGARIIHVTLDRPGEQPGHMKDGKPVPIPIQAIPVVQEIVAVIEFNPNIKIDWAQVEAVVNKAVTP